MSKYYLQKLSLNIFKQGLSVEKTLDKMVDGDELIVGDTHIPIKNTQIVDKAIKFFGKKSSIFEIEPDTVGFTIEYPKNIEFHTITFDAKDGSVAVNIGPLYDGEIIFSSCNIRYVNPFGFGIQNPKPLITYNGNGKLIFKDSTIESMSIVAPNADIEFYHSTVGSLTCPTQITAATIRSSSTKFFNTQLHSISGQTDLISCSTQGALALSGLTYIQDLTIDPIKLSGSQLKKPPVNLPEELFGLSLLEQSGTNIDRLIIKDTDSYPKYRLLMADQSLLQINDSNLPAFSLPSVIYQSQITYNNTTDQNMYEGE